MSIDQLLANQGRKERVDQLARLAIIEVNDKSEAARTESASAAQQAGDALQAANAAGQSAADAATAAGAASASAAQAQAGANQAQAMAAAADQKATAAQSTSAQALSAANAAVTASEGAQITADEAVSAAEQATSQSQQAVTTASQALTTASTAQATADGARSIIPTALNRSIRRAPSGYFPVGQKKALPLFFAGNTPLWNIPDGGSTGSNMQALFGGVFIILATLRVNAPVGQSVDINVEVSSDAITWGELEQFRVTVAGTGELTSHNFIFQRAVNQGQFVRVFARPTGDLILGEGALDNAAGTLSILSMPQSGVTPPPPPALTMVGGSSVNITVNENVTGVIRTAQATGGTGAKTYALSGTDAARFAIDTITGAITFVTSPNFEDPADANEDNVYTILVTATDAAQVSAAQTLNITVADVNEGGAPLGDGNSAPPSLTIDEDEEGTIYTVQGTGGTPPYAYSLNSERHFAIDAVTGAITAHSVLPGPYTVDYIVTDDDGEEFQRLLTVNVEAVEMASTVPDTFANRYEAKRFLAAASFGWHPDDVDAIMLSGKSQWFLDQLTANDTALMPIDALFRLQDSTYPATAYQGGGDLSGAARPLNMLVAQWPATENNQLAMKAAYALSNLIPVNLDAVESGVPHRFTFDYLTMTIENAFGTYRNFIEGVSRHAVMGVWLTHIGNRNPPIGDPDNNYGREVMQLFTIGIYDANIDGALIVTVDGKKVVDFDGSLVEGGAVLDENYGPADINAISNRFTGMADAKQVSNSGYATATRIRGYGVNGGTFPNPVELRRMNEYEAFHYSDNIDTFAGITLPAGQTIAQSMTAIHDGLINHPSHPGFIVPRMIRKLTHSNPSRAYIKRVVRAYNAGEYRLPDGTLVGSGTRSDLTALWAAILFDSEAFGPNYQRMLDPYEKVQSTFRTLIDRTRTTNLAPGVATKSDLDFTPLHNNEGLTVKWGFPPNVFNFHPDDYTPSNSPLSAAGLLAPEAFNWNEAETMDAITCLFKGLERLLRNGDTDADLIARDQFRETTARTTDGATGLRTAFGKAGLYDVADHDELIDFLEDWICIRPLAAEARTIMATFYDGRTAWSAKTAQEKVRTVIAFLRFIVLRPETLFV